MKRALRSALSLAVLVVAAAGVSLVSTPAVAFDRAVDINVTVPRKADYRIDDPSHSETINIPNPTIDISYENLTKLEIYDNGLLVDTRNFTGSDIDAGAISKQLSLTPGPHNIVVQGYDRNGVATSFTRSVNLNYDPAYTTPNFSIVSPSGGNTFISTADIKVQYTNIKKLVIYNNGQEVAQVDISSADQAFGSIIKQLHLVPGENKITIKGYDLNGNLISLTRTVVINYLSLAPPNTGAVRIGGMTIGLADYIVSGILVALSIGILTLFIKRQMTKDQPRMRRATRGL